MRTLLRPAAIAIAALPLALAACNSGYKPREQAAGSEITTHGLNVQEVERVAAELAESLLQSGRFASTEDPAMVGVSRFVNNTSQINIDRDRVTNRIFMVLVNSGRAEAYTPDDLSTEHFAGRTKDRRVYTINTKIDEDVVRQDRDKQVSYIFQMQLTEWRGDARPQVWIDERRITTESRR